MQAHNPLYGNFELAKDTPTSKPPLGETDLFAPQAEQIKTIEELYNGTREENLTRVVNPGGAYTPRSEAVSLPKTDIRDVTIAPTTNHAEVASRPQNGQPKPPVPKKSFWQKLFG